MSKIELNKHFERISKSKAFFPVEGVGLKNMMLDGVGDPDANTAFVNGDEGTNGILQLGEKITGKLEEKADTLNQYLGDFSGLCSAKMRSHNSSEKLFDPELWLECFRNLPLINFGKLEETSMSQSMKGVEIATSFLSTIVGFAVGGGPALVGFQNFLEKMGEQIRLGTDENTGNYTVSIVATGVTMGQDGRLLANMKGFFLDFKQSKSIVDLSCSSYKSFNVDFKYRRIDGTLNYSFLNEGKSEVREKLDVMLGKAQVDDIERSNNFFGANELEKQ